MAQCDLERIYQDVLKDFVQKSLVQKKSVFLSASALPSAPETLATDQLICLKGQAVGPGVPQDIVQLFAKPMTFQLMGLWILSAIFHEHPHRTTLELRHEGSEIVRITTDYKYDGNYWRQDMLGYSATPASFDYRPQRLERYPWTKEKVPDTELPILLLTNQQEMVFTLEEAANRDTIIGFGCDRAAVRFAKLCLDLGHEENTETEVTLEIGRGVDHRSSNVQLITPQTQRWGRIGSDYPNFGT
ncbi:hypothetical protein [Anderseniella sp. Alg231-50]|uniref:hypothetical protein n=1 Tax=Anderseniella sp. Alg231-50 TaxID=1922226 RepID=UPI000D552340